MERVGEGRRGEAERGEGRSRVTFVLYIFVRSIDGSHEGVRGVYEILVEMLGSALRDLLSGWFL